MQNKRLTSHKSEGERRYPFGWRFLASVAILVHLVAVFVAPWHHTHGSPLTTRFYRLFGPYLDVANINYGYDFFSPEPGNAMFLVRYELQFDDGRVEQGVIPDREKHWPRLLYHRHFMLTSKQITRSSFDQSLPPPSEFDQWENSPSQTTIAHAYARHLMGATGARRARIYLVQHRISTREEILAGKKLDDPVTYRERLLVDLMWDELEARAQGRKAG